MSDDVKTDLLSLNAAIDNAKEWIAEYGFDRTACHESHCDMADAFNLVLEALEKLLEGDEFERGYMARQWDETNFRADERRLVGEELLDELSLGEEYYKEGPCPCGKKDCDFHTYVQDVDESIRRICRLEGDDD